MSASGIKAGIRRVLANVYYRSGRFKRRLRGRVVIVAYHRVLPNDALTGDHVPPGMYVRTDTFAAQMQFLKEHFEVLAFPRLLELWTSGRLDARTRYCVVTFD